MAVLQCLFVTLVLTSHLFFPVMSLPTNILVAVFDDLRPQLGVYDHPEVLSPNINALAASPDSTLFTRAYTNYACKSPTIYLSIH